MCRFFLPMQATFLTRVIDARCCSSCLRCDAKRNGTELARLVRHVELANVALLDGVTIPVQYYGEGLHLPAETKSHTHRTPSVASRVAPLEYTLSTMSSWRSMMSCTQYSCYWRTFQQTQHSGSGPILEDAMRLSIDRRAAVVQQSYDGRLQVSGTKPRVLSRSPKRAAQISVRSCWLTPHGLLAHKYTVSKLSPSRRRIMKVC